MGVSLKAKKYSPTRKRFDLAVEKRGFFGNLELVFEMRIMSSIELSDDEVAAAAEETCERWTEKQEAKSRKWYILRLPGRHHMTIYIKKEE